LEETGLEVGEAIRQHPDRYIEHRINNTGKVVRLYIVTDWRQADGVDVSKHEITDSDWFHISHLPTQWNQEREYCFQHQQWGQAEMFRFVAPYVRELTHRLWQGRLEARMRPSVQPACQPGAAVASV
jgi:hypothetical protein